MSQPFRLDAITRAIGTMNRGQKLVGLGCVLLFLFASAYATSRYISHRAAVDEMTPILDQPFAETDLIQIRQHLDEKGIPNELRGGKVYVPSGQRLAVLSDLFYSDVLSGGGTDSAFEALVRQMSAWDPPSKTDKLFNKFRESTLRNVIGHFPGVRRATVMVDPTDERHIGASVHPSAMVDIQTEQDGGVDARRLASAAVNAVTGAVANLSAEQVKVTIDGVAISNSPEELAEANRLGRKRAMEQACAEKVKNLLAYIPGLKVTASVGLEDARRSAEVRPPATAPSHAQEPASVVVNAVPMIATPPSEAPASKQTSPEPARQRVIGASVAVPRSFFVRLFRESSKGSGATNDPDDGMLQPVIELQSRRIRSLVKNALGLADESRVSVEPYEDRLAATGAPGDASSAAAQAAPPPSAKAAAPLVTLTPVTAGNSIFSLGGHGWEAALVMASVLGALLISVLVRRREAVAIADGGILGRISPMADQNENQVEPPPAMSEPSLARDPKPAPFADLQDARADQLVAGLRDEHPRAIALVLSHLPADKSASVMERLDPLQRLEVNKQSAGLQLPDRAVLHRLERGLKQRLEAVAGASVEGAGDRAAAAILESTVAAMDELIGSHEESVEAPAAPSAVALAALAQTSDDDLRTILEQLDAETILMALRGADADLRQRVLANLVDDEAARIERKLRSHVSVRLRDIESAQQRVVEAVNRLEAAGEIEPLPGRDGREAPWR